jgi:RNA polymerase sigma-70 factor (ECF subfamily)
MSVESRAGAREARLAQLVGEHFDFIWRLLRRMGFERHEADDAAQEVFVVALRRLDTIEPGCERTFLYGAAQRTAANARRNARRRREVFEERLLGGIAQGSMPDELFDQSRTIQLLDELLRQIPGELSRLLILSEVLELDAKEIAHLEEIPTGTVASRLRRAREAFRKRLARHVHRVTFQGERP